MTESLEAVTYCGSSMSQISIEHSLVEQYVVGEDVVLGRNPALVEFTLPQSNHSQCVH
jgi:hypothetical protein